MVVCHFSELQLLFGEQVSHKCHQSHEAAVIASRGVSSCVQAAKCDFAASIPVRAWLSAHQHISHMLK